MPIRRTHRAIRRVASTLAGPPLPNLIARSSPAWWPRRSRQTRSHPELGRQTLQRPWYCASRPGRVGRRQARQDHAMIHHSLSHDHDTARRPTAAGQDAGWSSPVARQAHNLKAAGSNPAPATNTTTHAHTKPQGRKPRGQNAFRRARATGRGGEAFPDDPHRWRPEGTGRSRGVVEAIMQSAIWSPTKGRRATASRRSTASRTTRRPWPPELPAADHWIADACLRRFD